VRWIEAGEGSRGCDRDGRLGRGLLSACPHITGPGLQHTGQTAIICRSDSTLETRGDPWTVPPVSQITGLRRGSEQAETQSTEASAPDPGRRPESEQCHH